MDRIRIGAIHGSAAGPFLMPHGPVRQKAVFRQHSQSYTYCRPSQTIVTENFAPPNR